MERDKPHICPKCGRSFDTLEERSRHIIRSHVTGGRGEAGLTDKTEKQNP